MLKILSPIDEFENDHNLFMNLIDQFKKAFEDDPDFRISDFCEAELFPSEEYILDTETGKILRADEYAKKLITNMM